jgi:hypothetical protein
MGKFVGRNSRVATILSLGIEHEPLLIRCSPPWARHSRCYRSFAYSVLACFRIDVVVTAEAPSDAADRSSGGRNADRPKTDLP